MAARARSPNPRRVAIYARVSTDKRSTTNQVRELRNAAERLGWEVATQFVDHGPQRCQRAEGPAKLDALRKAVARKGVRRRRGVGGSPRPLADGPDCAVAGAAVHRRGPLPSPAGRQRLGYRSRPARRSTCVTGSTRYCIAVRSSPRMYTSAGMPACSFTSVALPSDARSASMSAT